MYIHIKMKESWLHFHSPERRIIMIGISRQGLKTGFRYWVYSPSSSVTALRILCNHWFSWCLLKRKKKFLPDCCAKPASLHAQDATRKMGDIKHLRIIFGHAASPAPFRAIWCLMAKVPGASMLPESSTVLQGDWRSLNEKESKRALPKYLVMIWE